MFRLLYSFLIHDSKMESQQYQDDLYQNDKVSSIKKLLIRLIMQEMILDIYVQILID